MRWGFKYDLSKEYFKNLRKVLISKNYLYFT